MLDKDWVVYNPHDKPISELPSIFGFNNGGPYGFMLAVAIAEDGTILGTHFCSDESFMPGDLGVIKGHMESRHATSYQVHYPDGYRMEFVFYEKIKDHVRLQIAFARAEEKLLTEKKGEAEC